ncbi:MAG: hypothetical protein Q7J54_05940 [Candidatus Woesearchaeota archaeon]|nr:hypothetical protein [Candidatus Woesearchaeota archaeon]
MVNVKELRPGTCILYRNKPYKVKRMELVTVGTHCHTKNKVEMEGIIEKDSQVAVFASHENLEEVDIPRKRAQVISKQDNKMQIMDSVSFETFDSASDLELSEGDEVIYVAYNGKIIILEKS